MKAVARVGPLYCLSEIQRPTFSRKKRFPRVTAVPYTLWWHVLQTNDRQADRQTDDLLYLTVGQKRGEKHISKVIITKSEYCRLYRYGLLSSRYDEIAAWSSGTHFCNSNTTDAPLISCSSLSAVADAVALHKAWRDLEPQWQTSTTSIDIHWYTSRWSKKEAAQNRAANEVSSLRRVSQKEPFNLTTKMWQKWDCRAMVWNCIEFYFQIDACSFALLWQSRYSFIGGIFFNIRNIFLLSAIVWIIRSRGDMGAPLHDVTLCFD